MNTIPSHPKRRSSSQSKKRSPKNYSFNDIAATLGAQDAISDAVRCRVPCVIMTSKQRRSARRLATLIERKKREAF